MAKKPSMFSRIVKRIGSFFSAILSKLSKLFDRIVYSKTASLVVSFLAACVICISINYDDINYRFFNKDAEVLNLSSVSVNANYDTSEYVVEGLPDTVSVTLTGSPADMTLYKNQYQVQVIADLSGFSAGENSVELKAANLPNGVTAIINPAVVDVTLIKKESRKFNITPELIVGTGQSEGEFEVESMDPTSVTITATKQQLDSIRTVKAIIDTSGQTKDFTFTAALVAYDSNGAPVSVTMSVDSVTVQVKLVEEDTQDADDEKESTDSDDSASESDSSD